MLKYNLIGLYTFFQLIRGLFDANLGTSLVAKVVLKTNKSGVVDISAVNYK